MTSDDQQQQTLRDAIARKAGAVVSFPAADAALHHHKTRLLAAQDEGFWIQSPADDRELIETLMASGQTIGLSLRAAAIKIVSASMILQFRAGERNTASGAAATPDALLLAWPSQVIAIQRRADFRVTVYPGTGVTARAWRIPNHHYLPERPPTAALLDMTLRNLSLGGIGVIYVPAREGPELEPDQRLRVIINHPGGELLIDGRVKHVRPTIDDELNLGIQFKKLEDEIEGRQTRAALTQIIGQLQRDEIRRARLAKEGPPIAKATAEASVADPVGAEN
jgi:hypothetical protein